MSRLVRKGAHRTSSLGPAKSESGVSDPQRVPWKERVVKTRTAHGAGRDGSGRVSHGEGACVEYSGFRRTCGQPSARSGSFCTRTAPARLVSVRPLVLSFFYYGKLQTHRRRENPLKGPHGPSTNITILPIFSRNDLFLIFALFSIEV